MEISCFGLVCVSPLVQRPSFPVGNKQLPHSPTRGGQMTRGLGGKNKTTTNKTTKRNPCLSVQSQGWRKFHSATEARTDLTLSDGAGEAAAPGSTKTKLT